MWLYELPCRQFHKKRLNLKNRILKNRIFNLSFPIKSVRETPELHYGMCSINSASARHAHRIRRSFPSHQAAFGPPAALECLFWCCSAVKKTAARKKNKGGKIINSSAALTQGFYFQAVRLCVRRRVPWRGFFKVRSVPWGERGIYEVQSRGRLNTSRAVSWQAA